ncbi:M1 family metallopeptidase [Bacillus sp. AGMB 02131]|uniref:M1 family metallopeptidase n=1 Tax=Peribacillus faecalis TaxID=2772559 RepID=A0A927CZJ3_9BACI|nr:M1 family metallopeptidase [Peribacillus faecalis]MBD3109901.1 M1 family metallopeptidase [Peribacillus faecalis]
MSKKLLWFSLFILLMILIVALKLTSLSKIEESMGNEKNTGRNFSPNTVPAGSDSQYDIDLKMTEDGIFHLSATVSIKNISQDSWSDLVFYFIPNIFTEETSLELQNPLKAAAMVKIHNINLDGEQVDYHLDKDTLRIPLSKKLEPDSQVKVEFQYEFTLPEGGLRFTKLNGNYHLAQFYPMVATYRNHKWNKEDYGFRGETYHTAFSDFKVSYEIPEAYTFVSSSEVDGEPGNSNGTFEIDNVKDIYIAILNDPMIIQTQTEEVTIRVFGFEDKKDIYREISEVAADALAYFQETIGPYPFAQLDIVIDSLGMEYPGIVTAYSIYDSGPASPDFLKSMVVHEIAHQWFYGLISNDPYHNGWLDEGMADFAKMLYRHSSTDSDIPYESMNNLIEMLEPLPVNLPLDQYGENMSSYIYGKSTTMLWNIFKEKGGIEEAENFLKSYYEYYQYKEVDSEEFVRFVKYYFDLEDDSVFEDWLLLE